MKFQGRDIITYPDLKKFPEGQISTFWMDLVANGIGQNILIPVMVAKGTGDGPVLGLTAVVHGNELNGLSVIQKVFRDVDATKLKGTLVGIPVLNVPSNLNHERRFTDGEDLNRIFPGKENGNESQVYAHRIVDRIVSQFDYLIDLHTASFGRINSYYIRVNMDDPISARMAKLHNADIILDAKGEGGTLRNAARQLGIYAITVEVGDPNKFQKGMIRSGLDGIDNVMIDLGMIEGNIDEDKSEGTVYCQDSYWLYANRGGILEVKPEVTQLIKKGELIATVKNIFGELLYEYTAPEDGIVIGKHVHPINQTGGRILHLGLR